MFSPSPAIPWKFIGTSCFHIVKIHNDMHLLGFIFICWAGYSVAYSSFLGMLLNFLFCSPPILVSLSCYKKKNTPTSWLNFHSFRSWKSKFKAPADSAAREIFPERSSGHITPCSQHFGSCLLHLETKTPFFPITYFTDSLMHVIIS